METLMKAEQYSGPYLKHESFVIWIIRKIKDQPAEFFHQKHLILSSTSIPSISTNIQYIFILIYLYPTHR